MRPKLLTLAGIALTGAVSLMAGAQTWVSFMLEGTHSLETAIGHDINPALSPVSIALIAAALALTIAGPVFRRVLGVLVALLGAGLVALTWAVLGSPLGSISGAITELTGLAGGAAGSAVTWIQVSPWVTTNLIVGCLAMLLGAVVLCFGGRWRTGGRKYDTEQDRRGEPQEGPDRISDWDSLSDGDDPSDNDDPGDDAPGDEARGDQSPTDQTPGAVDDPPANIR